MREDIEADGYTIDADTQLILLALADQYATDEDADHLSTRALTKACSLEKNQLVLYRLDNKLIPGGWATERHPDRNWRYFEITHQGILFVEEHREQIEPPQTVAEACELAEAARADVDALAERVQSVQGTVNSFEQQFDSLRSDVEDRADTAISNVDDAWNYAEEVRDDYRELATDVEDTRARVEALEQAIETVPTEQDLNVFRTNIHNEYLKLEEFREFKSDVSEDLSSLYEDRQRTWPAIEELQAEARQAAALREAGILERLWWLLTGRLPEPDSAERQGAGETDAGTANQMTDPATVRQHKEIHDYIDS